MPQQTPEKLTQPRSPSIAALTALDKSPTTIHPYRVIHEVEVPLGHKDDALAWLEEHFGMPAYMANPTRVLLRNQPGYDKGLLIETNYVWDGFFDPMRERLVFRIKDHDREVMMFKLTFGGKSDHH